MVTDRHIVEWHGERYTIEPLKSLSRVTALSPVWAVFRRGEFIGTLAYRTNEAPKNSRCAALSGWKISSRYRRISPSFDAPGRSYAQGHQEVAPSRRDSEAAPFAP